MAAIILENLYRKLKAQEHFYIILFDGSFRSTSFPFEFFFSTSFFFASSRSLDSSFSYIFSSFSAVQRRVDSSWPPSLLLLFE